MKRGIVLLTVISMLLTACMQTDSKEKEQQNESFKQVKDSDPVPTKEVSNQTIAEHLAALANRVPDVNEATAIVAGPYALVAIDVNKTLERERVGTVKYSVSEALYEDPYGKTAVVIADADLMERFKQMRNNIQEGASLDGIIEELAAIVGRYMPVMPTKDRANQPSKEKGEEESDLKDIQKDQSNSDKYE